MGELPRPPEGRSTAVGLLLADAKLAKVPLTVISFAGESFPSSLVAAWFGFKPEEFFEVESVAERATPRVSLADSQVAPKERER